MIDTEKILANLHLAHAVLSATPARELDLGSWKTVTACGTLHCAAGHLTLHPYFARFMKLDPSAMNERATPECMAWFLMPVDGLEYPDDTHWLDQYFGDNAYTCLFSPRDNSPWDCEYPDKVSRNGVEDWFVPDNVSDKALSLFRIERQIWAVSLPDEPEDVS